MQMFLNLYKNCLKLLKSVNSFFEDLFRDGLAHAGVVQCVFHELFDPFYENFLLVILCKYNLGSIRFAIAKWFFCGVFILCSLEVATCYLHLYAIVFQLCFDFVSNGYVDLVDTFTSISRDFWSLAKPTLIYGEPEPSLPKDLNVLTYETIDSINNMGSINNIESIESMNNKETITPSSYYTRPYIIYVCAIGLLYLGVCVAKSGA